MSKISPIYNMLNDRLVQFGVFHQLLSVESMVPYYGRYSAKMFIKGKPIRFGYTIWSLCGNDCYPYHLKLYQGKGEGRNQPLGKSIITKMVDVISSRSNTEKHQLYFENFFTSYDLLVQLTESNAKATGTIRENRSAGAAKALSTTKELQKMERGTFDHRSDGKVYVAKWNDNDVVGIESNWETHDPVHTVNRRVKGGVKDVSQPHLINSYNKGMGGVDLMD
ncbi:piggyBac transposable element-derived protein 3-like [Macrobrachium rosenbergii]|uniref:piggyBac transposable element-derived protein 3-like n=1 Tax=Macrobrachium rosenbergii TaxID=79674 RepID=UPI0034D7398B